MTENLCAFWAALGMKKTELQILHPTTGCRRFPRYILVIRDKSCTKIVTHKLKTTLGVYTQSLSFRFFPPTCEDCQFRAGSKPARKFSRMLLEILASFLLTCERDVRVSS